MDMEERGHWERQGKGEENEKRLGKHKTLSLNETRLGKHKTLSLNENQPQGTY